MLRVGILGTGGISGAHVRGWQSVADARITALCDIRPEQMERYGGLAAAEYTDADEMLEKEQLDILDICLPTYLHVEYSLKALERGIHVLCEKPISLRTEDVAKVYEAARKNGARFMVAQVVRFWPEYAAVKELYESQKYGKLLSGSMSRLGVYPRWGRSWYLDESLSGLVPFDLHIHDADFLVDTFGEPERIMTHRSKRPEQDYLSVVYEYKDFFVTAEASWYAAAYPFQFSFRFQFEHAVVARENGKMMVYEENAEGRELNFGANASDGVQALGLPSTDAYGNEIRYFAGCVRENKPVERVTEESLEAVIRLLRCISDEGIEGK